MNFERRKEHQRNQRLEELLKEVSALLGPAESGAIASFGKNKYPVVLIMGAPRSGTTLLLQWLAGSGCFCYPTNLLSRFYGAPFIGAKIQLMLTKHDFNNEIFDFNEEAHYVSTLGKTKGVLAPNEFWYFWRRFFHYGDIQYLSDDDLAQSDYKTFVSELAAIEAAFGLPLAMKAMIMNWNIPFMAGILGKALFIHIRRHPFFNIQSLLKARLEYYADIKGWYSFKPPEYDLLKDCSPYEQVAGQVHYTNLAVEEGLKTVDDAGVLHIDYEELCSSPRGVFHRIKDRFHCQGFDSDWEYRGPVSFSSANRVTISEAEAEKIIEGYKRFSGVTLSL